MSNKLVCGHWRLLSTTWDRQIFNQLFSSQDEYNSLLYGPNIYERRYSLLIEFKIHERIKRGLVPTLCKVIICASTEKKTPPKHQNQPTACLLIRQSECKVFSLSQDCEDHPSLQSIKCWHLDAKWHRDPTAALFSQDGLCFMPASSDVWLLHEGWGTRSQAQ